MVDSTTAEDFNSHLDGTAIEASLQTLTSAVHEMDAMLLRLQRDLLHIYGFDGLSQRWRDIETRFHDFIITSRLAASSMTVLLSHYHHVILPNIGRVDPKALRAEIAALTCALKRWIDQIPSTRSGSVMHMLCADITDLLRETKEKVSQHSKVMHADRESIISLLEELETQLNLWRSKRKDSVKKAVGMLFPTVFACVQAAGTLDPEALLSALSSIFTTTVQMVKVAVAYKKTHDLEYMQNVARRRKADHDQSQLDIGRLAQELTNSEQMDPSLAIRADVVWEIYSALNLELVNLDALLERVSACDLMLLGSFAAPKSGLSHTLIKMSDLFSKQTLLKECSQPLEVVTTRPERRRDKFKAFWAPKSSQSHI